MKLTVQFGNVRIHTAPENVQHVFANSDVQVITSLVNSLMPRCNVATTRVNNTDYTVRIS
jgi:hypothetical protein